MTTLTFHPANPLEQRLLDAQNGLIAPQDFMSFLMEAEVFMPVYEKHAIGGFGASQTAQPLLVQDPESGEQSLVLFSSPERAKAFVAEYPGYGGGLLVQFSWILEKAGVGYGISLNPGWESGMDLEAEAVRQLGAGGLAQ